ncbi:hypothetical protein EW093_00930 [Thiospirochaeta perfilievii]|uniref:Uncharacterized protein n=1 Tax=Thiospirochaeta perfilievii TaxID=252967 RepID=A0A5C1Q8W9_9SPIO|nr:hypothetical protein [Thiospirochaeta perfilievii]QEN03326.1 hypothetical protein EW093_00930 [Thiospirochaeta perfilievii]
MLNGFIPQRPKDKVKMLKSYRNLYIKEVSDGKKTKWEELTFFEKAKVDAKCLQHLKMIRF